MRGATVGACRLLGRGRGFAAGGAASAVFVLDSALEDTPGLALDTAPAVRAKAATIGRAMEGRVAGGLAESEVVRVSARRVEFCTDWDEGGRETWGRIELVPLNDWREDERGAPVWDG